MSIEKELRIMHACERGAVGVYRGHKCAARYFFRSTIPALEEMRFHEKDHAQIFKDLLKSRNARLCYGHPLFFFGGLVYGVFIGLFGRRAIGVSTQTIENIVNTEFNIALEKFKTEVQIYNQILAIQQEELHHQSTGERLAGNSYFLSRTISKVAMAGAFTAKFLASHL